ncbi:hypothetical protein P6709_15480 [Jeotgalibacillus sp. ET6]|uniref:TIGR04104 family putative zinc finger protein n=1 Tax=Jeotgalibacillus sp. ET6 TaxID=3037260 RepID=UPI0024183C59|nr:TIGR04104 family putative zinc finger protein [Jeotgalibacillus sp. ET6]MDG5473154.1 hypothetical protein [Jeotgalibacillus sp. ET6]
MPFCRKCDNKWSWKQTSKKTFTLNPAMSCPYCGETQYQTQKSRMKSASLNFFILIPLLINIFFDVPGLILLSSFPIVFILIISLHPFLTELSSEEEYTNLFK